MDTFDYVAITALIISLGSLLVNKKALDNAKLAQVSADNKLIESEKSEILKQISDNKSVLNKARIEIGALKANFEIEPQPVQAIMSNFTSLFTENLPTIENAISKLESDYANIINLKEKVSYSDIVEYKATCYEHFKGCEIGNEQAMECIKIFKEKLKLAHEHVQGATH